MKKSNERALCVPLLKKTKRIMKLTTLFSLGVACCISASTYAQGYKLSMNKQNSSIIEILKDIEKNSEFTFFFNDNKVNVNKKASINVKDATLDEALAQVLKNTGYDYQIIDRQVLIKTAPSSVSSVPSVQQNQKAITGIIKDVNGEPIIGANVVEKGTTNGTVTDIEGRFSLNVAPGATLVVSYIGYTTSEIVVGNKTDLAISLKEDSEMLEEVVVVGYGTMKKKDLTGAVAAVKGDDLAARKTTQLSTALQGAASGVTVTRDNSAPGATASIQIRGVTTIGETSPLVIVDGIPGDINQVNPEDVESMSVLKDAASASIYGSRAAAGVIVITTKRAKQDDLSLNYNFEYGWEMPTKLPEYVGAQRYLEMINETRFNDNNSGGWYQAYSEDQVNNWVKNNATNPDAYPIVDWQDAILKSSAPRQTHSINIAGGSKVVKTMPESESKTVTPDLYDESDRITVSQLKELIYCVDSLIGDSEDICGCFNAYNVLIFLCRFVGNKELADYYGLCSDYIYWVNSLDSELLKNREGVECRQTFKGLSDRMEALDMDRYSLRLRNNKQVIRVLQTWFDSRPLTSVQSDLQSFMQNKNRTVAELARYFNIMSYLKEKDDDLQELICENINVLLGCKVWEKKTRVYIPVFFGHEGVEKEFKTSAFIHADKNATEEQSLVLARVIASFMNTEGGTLYIGVNDKGYLTGLDQELRFAHNDSDVYLRSVNQNVIRLLGKKEDRDRYQAYIRCRLYEYEDGRLVLAFRVAPINEVVEVKGEVYTRSASSNLIKPVGNVADFVKLRHRQKLDSVPKMPEFPAYFSAERNEYIFDKRSVVPEMTAVQEVEAVAPVLSVNEENVQEKALRTKNANTQINLGIRTSALRCNPLQKKHDLGYTPNHVFVSLFKNGKIAYSVSPKIGKWGGEGGSVIFSYNPEDKEDLLVTVFKNGEVGLSNLKKGMSQPNMLFAFVGSIDDILFISPARSTDYLLLISDKEGEKRYRIVPLDMLEKSMSIQPKSNLVLVPEKGIFVFAEILIPELVNSLDDEKSLQDTFDQYCAGRLWEHNSYIKNVDKISNLCNVPF